MSDQRVSDENPASKVSAESHVENSYNIEEIVKHEHIPT